MPTSGGYSKRLDRAQNPGRYRTRFGVFQPALGVSSTGAVIRGPGGVGSLAGGPAPGDTPLWTDYGECLPYGGQDRSDGGREVTAMLWTVECRWGRAKPYKAGQMLFIYGTKESFQVDSVEIVSTDFRKFLLTCRVMK